MADISRLARFLNGKVRGFDLTANSIEVKNIELNFGTAFTATFDNSGDALTANRTITMPDANVDLGAIATAASGVSDNASDIADLRTTQGTADGDTDLGTFTGSTITDASSVKTALQELETSLETKAADADVIKKDGSVAFTGDQSMGTNKLSDLAAPTNPNDAARLTDVQAAQAGQFPKAPVDTISLSNITLSGEQTIEGVLTSASRILVAGQTDKTENGIYVTAAGAWARATDADGSPASEIQVGNTALVTGGTYDSNVFILNASNAADPAAIGAGTEEQEWIIYSRAESITASTGITKSGLDVQLADATTSNGISVTSGAIAVVLATDPGLEFSSNALRVKIKASGGITRDSDGLSVDTSGFIDDTAYSSSWDGVTNKAPSQNAVYDKINNLVADDVYGATWDGVTNVAPSLNAVYDKIELLVDDTAFGATWDGVTNVAPSQNAVYDKIDNLIAADIGFTPDDTGDWDVTPTETDAAINELAQRLRDSEETMTESVVAGTSIAGSTLLCLRWGKPGLGETAGRVYPATNDASSNHLFHVIGMYKGSAVTTGNTFTIVKQGTYEVTGHGLTVGDEHFLGTAGAVIDGSDDGNLAPSAVDAAIQGVCLAKDANNIDVRPQFYGIN